ncbi:MAG TPA: ABC-2 family transporter protein [Nocardioides sp.]|uniref:ABC transporter permease n=1 Tax=Nocardioides sp. TaxID=35761 RepID=UPI002C0C8FB9|nr:ABC-2 family transporter protein [Nocardioides sp.]HQR28175.1 ABC-2 family transporter protein [Nocardioides sp.]
MPAPGLYGAVATRSFRRFATYRAATAAGVFTNSVFGVVYSFAYLALWEERPHAGGYDAVDAVTFVWLGQALLMTVALWGGGSTDDLTDRVRTGAIALDLYRPASLLGWFLAADLGRAAYHFLVRGLLPMAVGALLFEIRPPAGAAAAVGFAVSVVLAVVVSFGLRFLVAGSAFWLLDANGPRVLAGAVAIFFSGMMLPLVIFPEPLRSISLVLPWASIVQTPIDVWLGQRTGSALVAALALQTLWIGVLLGAGQLMVRAATRRVVVQGG